MWYLLRLRWRQILVINLHVDAVTMFSPVLAALLPERVLKTSDIQ